MAKQPKDADPLGPFRRLFILRHAKAALEAVEGLSLDRAERVPFLKLLAHLKSGDGGPGWVRKHRLAFEEWQTKERADLLKLRQFVTADLERRKAYGAEQDRLIGDTAAFVDRDFAAPEAYLAWLDERTPGPFHVGRGRLAQDIHTVCAKVAVIEILKAGVGASRTDARAIARGLGFQPSGK
jgi:hypothetical protein